MRATELKDIRIVIIDDNGHSLGLLRSLLISLGLHRVVALRSTEEALRALRDDTYDVVFCDEAAGPVGPVGFLKALRRDLTTADVTIPVVVITGGASRKLITDVRDAGANDIIAKPVSAETVERKLRSLVLAPQTFVTAKTFLGPDRRRSDERRGERGPGKEDRRGHATDAAVFVRPPRVKTDEGTPS